MYNKFGGFGGGNMQNLLREAQRMQQEMQKKQQELESTTFESSVGGGMVTAQMNGKYELFDLKIKKEVVDPDDVEMLEDLIKSAISACIQKVEQAKKDNMPNLPNGMGF